jgi:hypothetical protein
MAHVALFGRAECPVCADSGSLICLKRVDTGALVFYCPLCGTGFPKMPARYVLDEVLSLEQVAPAGVALPTPDEVEATGLGLEEITDDYWADAVTPLLTFEPKGT